MERLAEIEARLAEIKSLCDAPEADLDALEEETRSLKEEQKSIKDAQEAEERAAEEQRAKEIEERSALLKEVEERGTVVKTFEAEEKKEMTLEEIRGSKEYVDAYAEYIKNGKDEEVRALLTTNVQSGTVPVPTFLESKVRHAWENSNLMQYCTMTFIDGNVKIGVETAADGATKHTEGGNAVTEESLTLVTVEIKPESWKKWISISDEVLDLAGEAFLNYIYDEIIAKIIKSVENDIVGKVALLDGNSTVPQATISAAPALGTIASAIAQLSDEASNPIIVMNKATWAAFKAAQYQANVAADPFEGLTVVFNNSLDAYSAADSGDAYMIVGDFKGVHANFPKGNAVSMKYDDTSLMTSDLVRILGRQYVGTGVVAPKAFCIVSKPSA